MADLGAREAVEIEKGVGVGDRVAFVRRASVAILG